MRYLTFDGSSHENYDIVFLVPSLKRDDIIKTYIEPFQLNPSQVLAYALEYTAKKTPKRDMKSYWENLKPYLKEMKTKYVVICDAEYFKAITGKTKAEPLLGYVIEDEFNFVYCPNLSSVFYDPVKAGHKINIALGSLVTHRMGVYDDPGKGIIQSAQYPKTYEDIKAALDGLLQMDRDLTCDIEAFSLRHYSAGIGTIGFAWNQGEGIAFPVDYYVLSEPEGKVYGRQGHNLAVRQLLIHFFMNFKRKIIFHNIAYDGMVLIYQLFMKDILDTPGLLKGMEYILGNWDDTRIIAYLATNTCAGNKLDLKSLSQEFAGDYAQDEIKDIRRIPLDDLLRYNLVDCLCTWFVRDKYLPVMIQDEQEEVYTDIFQPAMVDIIQMQLTGLPVNMGKVLEVEAELNQDLQDSLDRMNKVPFIENFIHLLKQEWVDDKNATLKKKRVTIEDAKITFNPNSDPQLRRLIYDILNFPVIDTTDSGMGSTGGDTLKKLLNHTEDADIKMFFSALMDFKDVDIILNNFIPAFKEAKEGPDGWHYLFGNFNLGGTKSGRLSSSKPNLQNIPANSRYAKSIKLCVEAPPGWLFVGLDFDSLEDRISALTTKDPNKLRVYTDGFDGHCLRAAYYSAEYMPEITYKLSKVNHTGKFYKVTIDGKTEYYHESDLPEDIKGSIGL